MQALKKGERYRENNFDCLRVYCMFMVILNHVADRHLLRSGEPNIVVYLFEGISHCAVPIFLMLTGAFLLEQMPNTQPKKFYIKSFEKLGVPTICFMLVYWMYDYARGNKDIKDILYTLLTGCSGAYAHWYVFMLAGIYVLLPIISIIKQNVDIKSYEKWSIMFLVWTILSRQFDKNSATWTIGCVFNFLGYVLIGDILKNKAKKNNLQGLILYAVGNIILCLDYYLLYRCVLAGGNYYNKLLSLYGAPMVAIATILIFYAFSIMEFRINMSYLSSISFYVFLCHKLVLDILSKFFFNNMETVIGNRMVLTILVELVITFIFSFIVAVIVDKIFKYIFGKKLKHNGM